MGDRRAGRAGPRHQPGAGRDVPGAGAGQQLALPWRYRLVQALLHSGRAPLRRHRPGPSPARAHRQNDRPRTLSARPVAWHATVEVKTREHFSELGRTTVPFAVDSAWFRGQAEVPTFTLDELLGTKRQSQPTCADRLLPALHDRGRTRRHAGRARPSRDDSRCPRDIALDEVRSSDSPRATRPEGPRRSWPTATDAIHRVQAIPGSDGRGRDQSTRSPRLDIAASQKQG